MVFLSRVSLLSCQGDGSVVRTAVEVSLHKEHHGTGVVCPHVSSCCVSSCLSHQSVWQGDVEEEHRGGGRGLPRYAHHRVPGTLLHLSRPHERHAQQGN